MLNPRICWCAVLILVALSGCSTSVPGRPTTSDDSSSATTSTAAQAATGIDTRTVDPCTAFTDEQVKALNVDGPEPRSESGGKPACTWNHLDSEPIGGYYVDTSDTRDISSIEPYPAGARTFKVGPFDAITASAPLGADNEYGCRIVIGVRPGQALQVAYSYGGALSMTQAKACEFARPAAEMAVQTLLARGGW